jgi:hypothetical protein
VTFTPEAAPTIRPSWGRFFAACSEADAGIKEAALFIHGTAPSIGHWLDWRSPMPHYFFDIKDGHRLIDPSGSNCKNDTAAIEKAKVLAIGVSLDKPAVDPTRRISVLNADRAEIFTVPVYSKPSA